MPDFQTQVLDAIARVVGGTVSPADPHFFSGALAGDGTGISSLAGCYSVPPPEVDKTPVGIVLVDEFSAELASLGSESNEDKLRLLILVAPYRMESQMAKLAPYRDTVPAAFRSHMQLYGAPSALDAFVINGRGGIHEWRGSPFLSYEFTVRVRRELAVTYSP